jgi:hypothetical protein
MSTQSTKTARRPAKAPRRIAKKVIKSAKSARSSDKKTAKSTQRGTGTSARAAAVRAPSAASKPIGKTTVKAAVKGTAKAAPMDDINDVSIKTALKMVRTSSPPVQPVATYEAPVVAHKYHVGETVYFTSPTFGRAAATGSYTVVKLLPSESDDFQYRIKSDGEAFERVAKESQLDKA